MFKNKFSKISSIIQDAKKGKMFILVDNKNRENEGDLIIPGSKCNSKNINFMAKHGRGLICLALTKKQVEILKLPLMSSINKSRMQTAFTVSIEAKKGVTTGISAKDRALTISTAINPLSGPRDLATPGHVFPLKAKEGGVLVRAGHTEAAVDISRLAGLNPSAVICEIMNNDGTMARMPDLISFANLHNLKLGTISDLISYRRRYDSLDISYLTFLEQIVTRAKSFNTPINFCGEDAGNPLDALALLAIGFTNLSMRASSIGRIRLLIRHISLADVRKIIEKNV